VQRGEDPSGVFRDPQASILVPWPDNRRESHRTGEAEGRGAEAASELCQPTSCDKDYFPLYAGQPEDVQKAYEEAMGF
jgi:hypothetical protein